MAKQKYSPNDIQNKSEDWGIDLNDEQQRPFSGASVQKFIKETFDGKIGVLYYDTTNNRYIAFADEESRDSYLEDPTRTELVLGTFDAPFNYTAEINLLTPQYVSMKKGSTGHYIKFTFDIKNKQGSSTGENVIIKVTFVHNAAQRVLKQIGRYGETVTIDVDDYLEDGSNTVIIGVTGQSSLAATTTAVTYQVLDLELTDELDISKMYNIVEGAATVEVPFTVSGYGTKVMEWYLDDDQLPFVKNDDEIVELKSSRVKYIELKNLSHGLHSIRFRAYLTINGEKYYTDTLHRDIFVKSSEGAKAAYLGLAVTIPNEKGMVARGFYDAEQYIPYTVNFATWSPTNQSIDVTIKLGDDIIGQVHSVNDSVNKFTFTPTVSGELKMYFIYKHGVSTTTYTFPIEIKKSSLNIQEITSGLALDFSASGRTNNSTDKGQWSYGDYTGTFTGFKWNSTSGWVDNRLLLSAGCTFAINYAPLTDKTTTTGKTLEFEFKTYNVSDEDTTICTLTDNTGTRLKITATEATLSSVNGAQVGTRFRVGELVRITFVINRVSGSSRKGIAMVYCNGIPSGAINYSEYDSFKSVKTLTFTGKASASVELKAIRIYDAALTDSQVLNNMILYRDNVADMLAMYNRNDIYAEGTETISPEKCMSRLPVVLITGDIPTLENTSDKNTQITVDVEYYDVQDPDRNFKMKNAALRPQGTSSMGYPKKNFRLYTRKIDSTIVYDSNDNIIESKLYSFKDKAQPVDCWCFKADYAESSGTHNTGIARMWNDALMNVQVDGEYVCRTNAQKAAIAAGYEYDVRTAIDGFPCLMFYRLSESDSYIFIGKYNFNNDKSTESVFGFEGIPGFDNSKMQCWEVLNNGNPIALFNSASDFNNGWKDAFESRYPDTSNPNITDLKAFTEWMVNVTKENFVSQKWQHFNVYMMAAYYIYLMRHAAADQFVKNAMLTSEDGQHFYFILYDNDTINGLINTGRLAISPEDDRESVDAAGTYLFAGHDSRLWNMLEDDEEFMQIVQKVDNALYSAGVSYNNCLKYFEDLQADKWVERVYAQDSEYKYLGPYANNGVNNLFMLQGKRDLHRKWFLSNRFAKYDAKFITGTYKSQAIEIKVANGTEAGKAFSIVAGYPSLYGYGVNNVPITTGISLEKDQGTTFTTKSVLNLGDPIRIYNAARIKELNLSKITAYITTINLAGAYSDDLGTLMNTLAFGSEENVILTEISGLNKLTALTSIGFGGLKAINDADLRELTNLVDIEADNTNIKTMTLPKGAPLTTVKLPATITTQVFEDLQNLSYSGLTFKGGMSQLNILTIKNCPNLSSSFAEIYNWVLYQWTSDTTVNSNAHLYIDNVNWTDVNSSQFVKLCKRKANGADITLKGKVSITESSQEIADAITSAFGADVFNPAADLYVMGPDAVFISGPDSILEGESAQFIAAVFSQIEGTIQYKIGSGSRDGVTINSDGLLKSTENGAADSTLTITAQYITSDGVTSASKQLVIKKRIYPKSITIEGDGNITTDGNTFTITTTTTGVTGNYIVAWTLSDDIKDYVSIVSQGKDNCVVKLTGTVPMSVSGVLTATLRKVVDSSTVVTATKDISAMNANVIMTNATNPYLMQIMYSKGLAANETFMTKQEAAAVTDAEMYAIADTDSYSYGNFVETFDEFVYFTGITKYPKFLRFNHLRKITFPPNVIEPYTDNMASTLESVRKIVLNEGLKILKLGNCGVTSIPCEVILPESIEDIAIAGGVFKPFIFSTEHPIKFQCSSFRFSINGTEDEEIDEYTFPANIIHTNTIIAYTALIQHTKKLIFKSKISPINIFNNSYSMNVSSGFDGVQFSDDEDCYKIINHLLVGKPNASEEKWWLIAHPKLSDGDTLYIPADDVGIYAYEFSSPARLLKIKIAITGNSALWMSKNGKNAYYGLGYLLYNCFNYASFIDGGSSYYNVDSQGTVTLKSNPDTVLVVGDTVESLSCDKLHNQALYNALALTELTVNNFIRGDANADVASYSSCDLNLSNALKLIKIIINGQSLQSPSFMYGYVLTTIESPSGMYQRIQASNCPKLVNIPKLTGAVSLISCKALQTLTCGPDTTYLSLEGCLSLKEINIEKTDGNFTVNFGSSESNYTGRNTYDQRVNMLNVPSGATGYDQGKWADVLCDANKCGFTINYTL